MRLLAPAGCGKTHALLWRCLQIAEAGGKEKTRFLLFTFTRAARDELLSRVNDKDEKNPFRALASSLKITTLNSWGYGRLKELHNGIRLRTGAQDRHFDFNNVLKPVWEKNPRIKACMEDSRRRHRAGQAIMGLIDELKSLAFRHDQIKTKSELAQHLEFLAECKVLPHFEKQLDVLRDLEILDESGDQTKEFHQHFMGFWREACARLFESSLISMDDQKYWTWIDLEQQLGHKRAWSGATRYHHIMVDEFQDINPLDLMLLKTLATLNRAELTLIGDDDQAIYEWRGASPEFILDPAKYLGNKYTTFILETNYRSPKNIVDLSQRLIVHNQRREAKNVKANKTANAEVQTLLVRSLSDSIGFVLGLVEEARTAKVPHRIAIVGRKRGQIIPYQIVFAGRDVPFYAAEDLHLFLSGAFKQLKEILAIRGNADASALIGQDCTSNLIKLCNWIKRYPLSRAEGDKLRQFLIKKQPKTLRSAVQALRDYRGSLKHDETGRMSDHFADAITALLDAKTVSASISALSEYFEGLQKDYGKSIGDIFYTDPPFLHLTEYAGRYGADYAAFYADVEKATDTLARIPPEEEADDGDDTFKLPLHLMTALRAKGKEFDTVIVLDANHGIWPSQLADTPEQLEQERRLFYVAMTRAKKRLVFLVNETLFDEPAVPTPYLTEMGLAPQSLRQIR